MHLPKWLPRRPNHVAILAILMEMLDFSIFSQNCSPQSVARFCKLALGHDAGWIELTHGCHTQGMRLRLFIATGGSSGGELYDPW